MFLLDILVDFFIDFGTDILHKFNYSRKTKRESIIFFTGVSISCLAAIIALCVLFFQFAAVGLRITCGFGVFFVLMAFFLQLSRFLRRMK